MDEEKLDFFNKYMEEVEKMNEHHIELDPFTVNYQDCLLETFKQIEDPFQSEIQDLNYDRTQALDNTSAAVVKHVVFKKQMFL